MLGPLSAPRCVFNVYAIRLWMPSLRLYKVFPTTACSRLLGATPDH